MQRRAGIVEYQMISKRGKGFWFVWHGEDLEKERERESSSQFFHICPHLRYEKPEPRLLFINPNFHKRTVNRTNSQENGKKRDLYPDETVPL